MPSATSHRNRVPQPRKRGSKHVPLTAIDERKDHHQMPSYEELKNELCGFLVTQLNAMIHAFGAADKEGQGAGASARFPANLPRRRAR